VARDAACYTIALSACGGGGGDAGAGACSWNALAKRLHRRGWRYKVADGHHATEG
jgi:hypothetical protein